MEKPNRNWASKREKKAQRLEKISNLLNGKYVETEKIVEVMEKLIAPGDKVVLEGDNQKQASFLSESLEKVDAEKVNDLHLIMSSISRPEHLNIFEKGIASKIDFSYAGAQSLRVAQMIEDGTMKLGDIHTYLELYGRLFIDLIPNVVLVAADKADERQFVHRFQYGRNTNNHRSCSFQRWYRDRSSQRSCRFFTTCRYPW